VVPLEQRAAKLAFECADLTAEDGLGDAEVRGGVSEMLVSATRSGRSTRHLPGFGHDEQQKPYRVVWINHEAFAPPPQPDPQAR